MSLLATTKAWAKRIKRDAMTLWFAKSHPDTPLVAKALGVFVVAYALSPIDLVPDFIPVLGYVDDIILLPILIWLAVRMLPNHVLLQSREKAVEWLASSSAKPRSWAGAVVIAIIWIGAAAVTAWWVYGLTRA